MSGQGNSLYPPIERIADHMGTRSYGSFFTVKERGKFYFAIMSSEFLRVLVWGHSFVKRLYAHLERGFHPQARSDFHLERSAHVSLFGHGGRTVPQLWSYDLHVVSRSPLDIIILEISTNDLSAEEPSLVAASIEVLVRFLHNCFPVKVICVCRVIPRHSPCAFNNKVAACNELVRSLLEPLPYIFCWFHKGGFYNKTGKLLLADGVHVNRVGQYRLYRSYRGVILRALTLL